MTPRTRDLLSLAQDLTPNEKLCLIDGLFESLEALDDARTAAEAEDEPAGDRTGIFPLP